MPQWGRAGYPVIVPAPPATPNATSADNPHLRSAKELFRYGVEANDGTVGQVIDFLIDGRTWMIREVVVECGPSFASKKVIVPTEKISRINYKLRTVHADSTTQAFETASEQGPHTRAA
jgi:hypothetical protein